MRDEALMGAPSCATGTGGGRFRRFRGIVMYDRSHVSTLVSTLYDPTRVKRPYLCVWVCVCVCVGVGLTNL